MRMFPPKENEMYFYFSNSQLTDAGLVLLALLIVATVVFFERRRRRSVALRARYGSEYGLAVMKHGSSRQAEAKLADRETRVDALNIRDLGNSERERFVREWQAVQSRFVDYPKAAVTEADDLVNALLEARGYPKAIFEQRAADGSVTYPHLMENYRLAHAIAVRNSPILATTEELRTSMIQYRAIFDELILAQKARIEASAA